MKKQTKHWLYALDIGSKKITLVASEVKKGELVGSVFIETQPSRGIFKGVVNDLAALTEAVQVLFKKIEKKTMHKALQTALSINGNYIDARHSIAATALSERGTRSITKKDIERLNSQARMLGLELDEHLLHEYPQGYSIDRHNMTLSPLGLHGRKCEVDLLLICAKTAYVENIAKAVENAGLDVVKIVFSGIAASEAVLSIQEREKGVVLVDIGDALTSVLVFKDGIVRRLNVLTFGGRNIADVIANYFRLPLDVADRIKDSSLEVGHDIPEDEEVMIKEDQGFKPIKKKELAEVVAPEIDRFIGMIRSIVVESAAAGVTGPYIVVTGGLSLIEGLLEKMEHDLGLPVKMGMVRSVGDLSALKTSAYACALGLLSYQAIAMKNSAFVLHAQGKNKISKFCDFLANLYQDYF